MKTAWTKIEANTSKYTFVWNKSIRYYERQLDEKIRKQQEEIEILEEGEQEIYQEEDLEEIGEKTDCPKKRIGCTPSTEA